MIRSSSLAMQRYSVEPRTRKYAKGHGFFIIREKILKLINGYKTRRCKNCLQKSS